LLVNRNKRGSVQNMETVQIVDILEVLYLEKVCVLEKFCRISYRSRTVYFYMRNNLTLNIHSLYL